MMDLEHGGSVNDFFKQYSNAIIVLTAVCGSLLWMNSRFNEIDQRFSNLEREVAIVKTVMIMKNVMPVELAAKE